MVKKWTDCFHEPHSSSAFVCNQWESVFSMCPLTVLWNWSGVEGRTQLLTDALNWNATGPRCCLLKSTFIRSTNKGMFMQKQQWKALKVSCCIINLIASIFFEGTVSSFYSCSNFQNLKLFPDYCPCYFFLCLSHYFLFLYTLFDDCNSKYMFQAGVSVKLAPN